MLRDDGITQFLEVLRKRFRIVGEVAVRRAVDGDAFHAQTFEQTRHDDGAYGIDRIEDDLEVRIADGFLVHGFQVNDRLDMLVGEIMFRDMTQFIHTAEVEILGRSAVQDSLALGRIEEFTLLIEEFQGVPLTRVVGGGQDDAAVRTGHYNSQFRGRRRGIASLDDIDATGDESTDNQLLDHLAGDAGVLADDHLVALPFCLRTPFAEFLRIGVGEFDDVDRGQRLARSTADGTADTGNGFNQGHSILFFYHSILSAYKASMRTFSSLTIAGLSRARPVLSYRMTASLTVMS